MIDAPEPATTSAELARRRFVARASHELRTPLTVVVTSLELAAAALPDGPPRRRVELARQAAQRANRVVVAVLELSRPGPPRRPEHPTTVAAAVAVALAQGAPPTHLTVDVVAGSTALWLDATHLEIMVGNLVANAGRFARSRIVVATDLDLRRPRPRIEVVVDDDGPGFDAHLVGTDPQEHRTGARPGHGLGLATVAAFAAQHGGRVRLANGGRLGGAHVVLELPVGAAAPASPVADLQRGPVSSSR